MVGKKFCQVVEIDLEGGAASFVLYGMGSGEIFGCEGAAFRCSGPAVGFLFGDTDIGRIGTWYGVCIV